MQLCTWPDLIGKNILKRKNANLIITIVMIDMIYNMHVKENQKLTWAFADLQHRRGYMNFMYFFIIAYIAQQVNLFAMRRTHHTRSLKCILDVFSSF